MDKVTMKKVQILLGQAIIKRRTQLNISQEVLAEKADIHRTHVSRVELGKRNSTIISVYKLAKALDTSVSHLCKDIK